MGLKDFTFGLELSKLHFLFKTFPLGFETFGNHPKPLEDEDLEYYYARTSAYWLQLLFESSVDLLVDDEIDESIRANVQAEAASMMAKAYFKRVNKER